MKNSIADKSFKNGGAYLALSGAFCLAGSSVVAGKLLASRFPVFLVSALSLVVAMLILIPVIVWRHRQKVTAISRTQWLTCLCQAFFGIFLFRIFILWGVQHTSAMNAGIITSTTPAVIAILARLFLKEKLKASQIIGTLLTVAGIMMSQIMSANAMSQIGKTPFFGNLLIFGAVLGEALFSIFSKKNAAKLPGVIQTALVCLWALLLFLPLGLYEASHFNFNAVSFLDWMMVGYYGAFVTVAAYLFWFKGIAKVPAATAGVFTGLMPVSAALLSWWLLKEPLTGNAILSLILVASGLMIIAAPSYIGTLLNRLSNGYFTHGRTR